jgi:hypothetical protein
MAVNVLGTWHVLLAAEAAGAGRVVYFSSGQVFGIAEGERLPDYFPVDDALAHVVLSFRVSGLAFVSRAWPITSSAASAIRTASARRAADPLSVSP